MTKPRSKFGQWINAHPRKALVAINVVIIVLVLAILEPVLRSFGYVPGYVGPDPGEYLALTQVDSLEVDQRFITDSNRIFKAIPDKFIGDLKGIVVNRDGFRGREFEIADSSKPRVLFIGDSFTWGANAEPITEAFVELVEAGGYACYNGGIPGTSPVQYARVAETYFEKIKPEVVCVSFFMGNDVIFHRTEPEPFQNLYHITNAGWLNAFFHGEYMESPKEAYDYYMRRYMIPNLETDLFNRFCAQTVVGSMFWKLVNLVRKDKDPVVEARFQQWMSEMEEEPVSYEYLGRIKALCEKNGARFELFVIPVMNNLQPDIEGPWKVVFKDLSYHLPTYLEATDYYQHDGHFTNQGHQKFAKFILETLNSK